MTIFTVISQNSSWHRCLPSESRRSWPAWNGRGTLHRPLVCHMSSPGQAAVHSRPKSSWHYRPMRTQQIWTPQHCHCGTRPTGRPGVRWGTWSGGRGHRWLC